MKKVLKNKRRILRNENIDGLSPEPTTNIELGQDVDFMSFFERTEGDTEKKPESVLSEELTFMKPIIKTTSPSESKQQINVVPSDPSEEMNTKTKESEETMSTSDVNDKKE